MKKIIIIVMAIALSGLACTLLNAAILRGDDEIELNKTGGLGNQPKGPSYCPITCFINYSTNCLTAVASTSVVPVDVVIENQTTESVLNSSFITSMSLILNEAGLYVVTFTTSGGDEYTGTFIL